MSRQNKINPAHYTQRGRLTPDDAARELARQRSIGSQHTWQPVKKNALPRLPFTFKSEEADRSADTPEEVESPAKKSSTRKASTVRQASDVVRVPRSGPGAAGKAKAGKAKKSAGRAMAARATPSRATKTKTTRKAVLARNVGGPALKPLRTAKRRKN